MKTVLAFAAALILSALPALAADSSWNIDPDHSNIAFKVRHMMVSNVRGGFGSFRGVVEIDDQDLARSRVAVTIDTASIHTGLAKRDEHLRSADFLDVAKHPTMTFISRKVTRDANGRLKVYGDLTLRGVTREVVLNVEGPTAVYRDLRGASRRGASAVATISRKDFGVIWNAALEAGGVVVGDEVSIALEVELVKN